MASDFPARAARRAEFQDVTAGRSKKKPRWLTGGRSSVPPPPSRSSNLPPEARPSLRAAAVPKEFVMAMQRELRPISASEHAREIAQNQVIAEQMARSLRPSELPGAVPSAESVALELGFRSAIQELASAQGRILEATAGQLATLAAVIARRVIARELELAPDVLTSLVREALDALSERSELRVRVGRGFSSAVDGLEQSLAAEIPSLRVQIDPSLDDYACIVETELGQVDESIERRLEKLLEALKPDSEAP
jgi:flagellar assembly protein FliH